MEKSYASSPQLTLKSVARHAHMKARKRLNGSIKHVSPQKPKKTVSFSALANIKVREISREELNESWIQPEEYSEIEHGRKQCLETVKRAILGRAPPPDPSEYCVYGLEQQLSSKKVLERKMKNLQYRRLLLEEQDVQRICGVSDPQALQTLSEVFSQQAIWRARRRASTDNALAA